jgi:hypothetical protein
MSTGTPTNAADLRRRLVGIALQWQECFGVAPAITSVVSELDAARLVGMPDEEYCAGGADRTSVTKGYDFKFRDLRYQVKANRPSGKPGSPVTLVARAHNYDWDKLIWIFTTGNTSFRKPGNGTWTTIGKPLNPGRDLDLRTCREDADFIHLRIRLHSHNVPFTSHVSAARKPPMSSQLSQTRDQP